MKEGHSDNSGKEEKKGFITIDELLVSAEYLYKGLINLSNQRHPLLVYKGVKNMEHNNQHEIVKISSRTYFFDVETAQNGKRYLKITESRINTETKEQTRNTILVFQEGLQRFADTMNAMVKRMQ
jgi:hypothetical protein